MQCMLLFGFGIVLNKIDFQIMFFFFEIKNKCFFFYFYEEKLWHKQQQKSERWTKFYLYFQSHPVLELDMMYLTWINCNPSHSNIEPFLAFDSSLISFMLEAFFVSNAFCLSNSVKMVYFFFGFSFFLSHSLSLAHPFMVWLHLLSQIF